MNQRKNLYPWKINRILETQLIYLKIMDEHKESNFSLIISKMETKLFILRLIW